MSRATSDIERPVADEENKVIDESQVDPDSTELDEAEASDAAEPQNRRARRAAASQARKHRLRERREAEAVGLDAQEILDDALVRSTDTAAKWFRRNSNKLQWALVVGVVGWSGWGIYGWRAAAAKAEAADAVAAAVDAERGRIGDPAEQGQLNEQNVVDPTPIFKDREALLAEAKQRFEQAAAMRSGSGTALYAKLALAAVLFDSGQYDDALAAYNEVKDSKLAASDPELRGRALEGLALVAVAKGDKKGAIGAYEALAAAGIDGFTELAQYQQARLHQELGETDKAKELVGKLKESVGGPAGAMGMSSSYLQSGVQSLADELGLEEPQQGSKPITAEQLNALQRQVQTQIDAAQLKAKSGQAGDTPANTQAEDAPEPQDTPVAAEKQAAEK